MTIFRMMRITPRLGVALLALTLIGAVTGCGGSDDGDDDQGTTATADLIDTSGRRVGTARFLQNNPSAPVTIRMEVSGLTRGQHGVHLHQVGRADPDAEPPFATAGEHINPDGNEHGLENPDGAHAGDFPNLNVRADEGEIFELTTDRVTLYEGANSLLDADGSALVIHANADDQVSDPTGGTGGRVVCGVVERE